MDLTLSIPHAYCTMAGFRGHAVKSITQCRHEVGNGLQESLNVASQLAVRSEWLLNNLGRPDKTLDCR